MTELLDQQTEQSTEALELASFKGELSDLKKEVKDQEWKQEPPLKEKEKKNTEQLEPIYVTDPNDPRLKAYQDSLDLRKLSKKISKNPDNLPEVSKEEFERIYKKDEELPYWKFDNSHYEKDKKEGKIGNFREYVYDLKHPHTEREKMLVKYKAQPQKETLPNGEIKEYDLWDKTEYRLYDPISGTSRRFSGGKLTWISSKNIQPIKTQYFAEDKLILANSISLSSKETGRYKKGEKPIFKDASNETFQNYFIARRSFDVYAKPTQPIFLEGTPEAEAAKKQQELQKAKFKIEVDGKRGKNSQAMRDQYQKSKANSQAGEEKMPEIKSKSEEEKRKGILKETQWNEWVPQKSGGKAWEDTKTEKEMQSTENVEPLYVTDPNDPRLKNYKDNLSLYNYSNQLKRLVNKTNKNDPRAFLEKTLGNALVKRLSKDEIAEYSKSIFKRDEPPFDALNNKIVNILERQMYEAIRKKRPKEILPNAIGDETIRVIMDDKSATYLRHFSYYAKPTQPVFLEGTPEADAAKKQQELQKAKFKIEVDGKRGKNSQAMRDQYQKSKASSQAWKEKVKTLKSGGGEEETKPDLMKKKLTKPETDTSGKFMLSDGKRYSYEELIKANPQFLNDTIFKRNFPGRERPTPKSNESIDNHQ